MLFFLLLRSCSFCRLFLSLTLCLLNSFTKKNTIFAKIRTIFRTGINILPSLQTPEINFRKIKIKLKIFSNYLLISAKIAWTNNLYTLLCVLSDEFENFQQYFLVFLWYKLKDKKKGWEEGAKNYFKVITLAD